MIPCEKEETLGKLEEFKDNIQRLIPVLVGAIVTIVLAIVVQIGSFLFMWGGVTTTVKYHDEVIKVWNSKLANVTLVGYMVPGPIGPIGPQGPVGEKGK